MRIGANYDSALYGFGGKFGMSSRAVATEPLKFAFGTDSVSISSEGRRMADTLKHGSEISTHSPNSLKFLKSPAMRDMGESIIDVKETLASMKELAELAKDNSLSLDDRIDLQIEMTKLQVDLYDKTHGMALGQASPDKILGSNTINPEIYEQRDRIISFLERMRPGGAAPQAANQDTSAGTARILEYSGTDFELDENGYLKMEDGFWQSLSDQDKVSMYDTMSSRVASGTLFPEHMENNEILDSMNLMLLSPDGAAAAAEKIDQQLGALAAVEKEFNFLAAINPTASRNYNTQGDPENGIFVAAVGVMAQKRENGQPDEFDVRLLNPKDSISRLFAKTDTLFKDSIYASLGLGDTFKATTKAKGINPEQQAEIDELKNKFEQAFLKLLEEQAAKPPIMKTYNSISNMEQKYTPQNQTVEFYF